MKPCRILLSRVLAALLAAVLCTALAACFSFTPTPQADTAAQTDASDGSQSQSTVDTTADEASGDTAPAHTTAAVTERQTEATGTKAPLPQDSSFAVHFIDVGQADAALIVCDGEAMLIDGGNVGDSDRIYTYLKKQNIGELAFIVCTHAHEDHVGGLAGALNAARAKTAFAPVRTYDSRAFESFLKYLGKQGLSLTVPQVGDRFSLGSATGQFVGPVRDSDEPNNTSLVIRITYGDVSFLFTGDAEREEEADILNAGYTLASTVLKVGHHGSDSSSTYPFLREVMPQYAIISVGKGNSYGHPTESTLSRLRDCGATVIRTDLAGDIVFTSDGKTVQYQTTATQATAPVKTPDTAPVGTAAPTDTAAPVETSAPAVTTQVPAVRYIGNISTLKFHYPSCGSVARMNESNKLYFTGTREELIARGYVPCKNCDP